MMTTTAPARTLTPLQPPTAVHGPSHSLVGTGALLRTALRRDLVRNICWIIGIVGGTVSLAVTFPALYETEADRQVVAQTMGTPAGLAFTGPIEYLRDYSLGSIISHQMIGFTGVLVGIMSVLLIIRHTRTEEETGRAELTRAGTVGRHAPLAAAVSEAVLVNLIIGALIAAGLGVLDIDSVDWPGSILYGAAHVGIGIAFIGCSAVIVQIFQSARTASEIGIGLVLVAYALRAAGDSADNGVSWASPIGWGQRTYPYLDNDWWPLTLCLGAGVLLTLLGAWLSTRRDVASGLVAARQGRPRASAALKTPGGFALRLLRPSIIAYAFALIAFGAMYGPFLGDIEDMIAGVDVIEGAISSVGGTSVVDSFLVMVMSIIAILAAVFCIGAVLRIKGEEEKGRSEALLANWQSRMTWMSSHVPIALIAAPIMLALAAVGMSALGAGTVDDPDIVGKIFGAALVYTPGMWVFVGLAALVVGWAPRLSVAVWLLLGYAGFTGYFGPILQLDEWTTKLSPFGYVPRVPADDMEWLPVILLTLVAAVLVIVGMIGYRRRDLQG